MDFIIDAIVEWLKGLLVDGIMGNLDGLFDPPHCKHAIYLKRLRIHTISEKHYNNPYY